MHKFYHASHNIKSLHRLSDRLVWPWKLTCMATGLLLFQWVSPRKWTQGPPAAVGERYLTAGLGCPLGRTWPTAEGSCLPLCGLDVEK